MKTEIEIERAVIEAVATIVGVKPGDISLESSFDSLGLDSLDAIEVVMEVEDRLEVELDDAVLEQVTSVRGLTDCVLVELRGKVAA